MLRGTNIPYRLAVTMAACMLAAGPAAAAGAGQATRGEAAAGRSGVGETGTGHVGTTAGRAPAAADAGEDRAEARDLVQEAVQVVRQMESDSDLQPVMRQAKGIYIVPDFGRAALGIGARGGAGVLMVRQGTGWQGPAFYDFGGISAGLQAGASAGQIAFLLMGDDAVQAFRQQNNFSLNADSGLSIINYSANAQASWGKGDVVLWSDTEGAFAGVELSVSDINWDDDANRAYYGRQTSPGTILDGTASNEAGANPLANALHG